MDARRCTTRPRTAATGSASDDAVTAWYLLAAETIDETMIELIARKRGIVDAVTDGRRDESEALVQAVVRELRDAKPRRRLRSVA